MRLPVGAHDRSASPTSQNISGTSRQAFACRATQIFPALPKYLQAGGSEEAEAQRDLKGQVTQLDSHLKSHGPWITGHSLSAGDLALGPKLHHVQVTCKHFKVMPHFECFFHICLAAYVSQETTLRIGSLMHLRALQAPYNLLPHEHAAITD